MGDESTNTPDLVSSGGARREPSTPPGIAQRTVELLPALFTALVFGADRLLARRFRRRDLDLSEAGRTNRRADLWVSMMCVLHFYTIGIVLGTLSSAKDFGLFPERIMAGQPAYVRAAYAVLTHGWVFLLVLPIAYVVLMRLLRSSPGGPRRARVFNGVVLAGLLVMPFILGRAALRVHTELVTQFNAEHR
jgi:hypothetical protein